MALGFVLATIRFFSWGISYPLIDRTETRVAEISREILVTGDWTTLHLNFQPYYDKPPFCIGFAPAVFKPLGLPNFQRASFPRWLLGAP